MKLIISGASGFVGRHFLREIEKNRNAKITVASWQKSVHGDITDESNFRRYLEMENPSVFVHLAWLDTSMPEYESNVANQIWGDATIRMIKACNEFGIRSIIAGSVADAQSVDGRSTTYGLAKRRIREYIDADLIKESTLVRFHYLLSVQDLRPRLLSQIKMNRNLNLENPNSKHDFIHIHDAAVAMYSLLHIPTPSIVDIASGRLHSVKQLRDAFLGESKTPVCNRSCQSSQVSIDTLREKLWVPSHTDNFFHRVPDMVY